MADIGTLSIELSPIVMGVGEDDDGATGVAEEAVNGPGREGEGFATLAAPEPEFDAVGGLEGVVLVAVEEEPVGKWDDGNS